MTVKKTRVLNDRPKDLRRAAEVLKAGGLVAFPTETVYGLGANGLDPAAVAGIFAAKGRPADNPLILHIADPAMLETIVRNVADEARTLMERYWPGPLTLVFQKADTVPDEVSAGLQTVAVRMPDHPVALELIRLAGVPLAAPSANVSGRPSPTRGEEVLQDLDGRVDGVILGDVSAVGLESTIVDVSQRPFTLLRPGAVTLEQLREVLGPLALDPVLAGAGRCGRPRAPGMKYRHYAPDAQVVLMEGTRNEMVRLLSQVAAGKPDRVGVLSTGALRRMYRQGEHPPFPFWFCWGEEEDPEGIARRIYLSLREADRAGMDLVYVESLPEDGLLMAVMNRLRKAAGGRTVRWNE